MVRLVLLPAGGPFVVTVEIPRTADEMATGLAGRRSLAQDRGMLFVYPRPQEVAMWMRGTLIPLDMVFLRPGGVVHRIEKMAAPGSLHAIASRGPVIAVLELAGGTADAINLRPEMRVLGPLESLQLSASRAFSHQPSAISLGFEIETRRDVT